MSCGSGTRVSDSKYSIQLFDGGLSRSDRKQPDGVTIAPWKLGCPLGLGCHMS